MQFENKTYESLLTDMLSAVAGDVLKIEGSIIHDAIAPAAMVIAEVYESLEFIINQTSVATATTPYLDRLTEQMGIIRNMATYAERRGEFFDKHGELIEVPIGSRFSIDAVNYVVEEAEVNGFYRLMAEDPGSIGNIPIGEMQALDFIDGLGKAILSSGIIDAVDIETDDALRERYFEYIVAYAQDGNVGQYQKWTAQYPDIGRSKIFPLWYGVNTVKVSILDTKNNKATDSLIAAFQNYLDPGSKGLGNGVAPIGAIITVTTADEKVVNVTAAIEIADGYGLPTVQEAIRINLSEFFSRNAYKKTKVFYMDLGVALLNTAGVASVSTFALNDGLHNINLGDEEIGKLGSLSVTEA